MDLIPDIPIPTQNKLIPDPILTPAKSGINTALKCIQINGAFGVDFSTDVKDAKTAEECLRKVGVGLLSHGKETKFLSLLNDRATWETNYILPYL